MATLAIPAPACASCVFGATSTRLLSFPVKNVETITVSVVPHVTVFPNGQRTTHYESIFQTESDFVHSNYGLGTTYHNPADITWTVGDATLTYPTTYVQYVGFEGGLKGTQSCAVAQDAVPVTLPEATDPASYIYPLQAGATQLPIALLDYLQYLPEISAQFHGEALSTCAALDNGNHVTRSLEPIQTPSPLPETTSPSPLVSTSSPQASSTTTSYSRSSNVTNSPTGDSSALPVSFSPSLLPSRTTPIIPPPEVSESTKPTLSQFTTLGTSEPLPLSEPPTRVDDHSTAYVISVITGRAIITTGPNTGLGDITGTNTLPPVSHEGPDATKRPDPPTLVTTPRGGSQVNNGGGSLDSNPTTVPGRDTNVVGNGGTATRGPTPKTNGQQIYNAPHTKITAQSDGVVVYSGKTIAPGHSITIGTGSSATVVALQTHAGSTQLVVGHHTYSPDPVPDGRYEVVVSTDGHVFTALETSGVLILEDSSSRVAVHPDSVVTFDGQTVSAEPGGRGIVVNGHTTAFSAAPGPAMAVVTADGLTLTAIEENGSVILEDGKTTATVREGATTRFEGQSISADPSKSVIVVNGKTFTMTQSSLAGNPTSQSGDSSSSGSKDSPSSAESVSISLIGAGLVAMLGVLFAL